VVSHCNALSHSLSLPSSNQAAASRSSDDQKANSNSAHTMSAPIESVPGDEVGIAASVIVGPGIYHIGIIDVLQQWNWRKRLEQWAKIFFKCHCNDYKDLSVVEPRYYSKRFIGMVEKLFE